MVRRGEIVLDFDVIDTWDRELEIINDGRKPYMYPDSFIQLHLPYRQTEGVVRVRASKKVPIIPDLQYNKQACKQT
ncbi:MAG: transposase [Thermoproteota archaeon]|nr:transposase [Thermoproteota archaeon]